MSPDSTSDARPLRSAEGLPDRNRTVIRAHPDGPFVVRGPVTVLDGAGREVTVRRKIVALCRCGRSRTQPLCDGMHTPAGFTCHGGAHDLGSDPRDPPVDD